MHAIQVMTRMDDCPSHEVRNGQLVGCAVEWKLVSLSAVGLFCNLKAETKNLEITRAEFPIMQQ